jgi:hypothetical protein
MLIELDFDDREFWDRFRFCIENLQFIGNKNLPVVKIYPLDT